MSVATFTNQGAAILGGVNLDSRSVSFGDIDNDRDLDIYISTCNNANHINNNFFENQLAQTGTLGTPPHQTRPRQTASADDPL